MAVVASPITAEERAAGEELVRELPRLPAYPALYQVNTRVRLRALGAELGRPATLDDIPDTELDRLGRAGLRLGLFPRRLGHRRGRAWRLIDPAGLAPCVRGASARSRGARHLRLELRGDRLCRASGHGRQRGAGAAPAPAARARPAADAGLRPQPHGARPSLGAGAAGPVRQRQRGAAGTRAGKLRPRWRRRAAPWCWRMAAIRIFPGWPDTLQLDYGNPATQEAMRRELLAAASLCDGLRCDMAMLILPDVFQRTWGVAAAPFWPDAIRRGPRPQPELRFHGRGVLGPRMDDAAARV